MAILSIIELTAQHEVIAALHSAVTKQTVAIGATSTQSDAFGADTRFIRLASDSDTASLITVGADPTAAAGDLYFPASHVEYFKVNPGDKLAVIQSET